MVLHTLEDAKLPSATCEHDDLGWFIGRMPAGAGDEADAQAWLDALPVEPATRDRGFQHVLGLEVVEFTVS